MLDCSASARIFVLKASERCKDYKGNYDHVSIIYTYDSWNETPRPLEYSDF